MAVFLDASYFLALYSEKDVHHSKAVRLAKKLAENEYGYLFTSDHIFDETISVALRKYGKSNAIFLGKQLLASVPLLVADHHVLNSAWNVFMNTKHNFSFTDCTNLVFMEMADTNTLATFDKEFKKVPRLEIID